MSAVRVGDRVTPENVAGLPVNTVVEWTNNDGEHRESTKTGPDMWSDPIGQERRFTDEAIATGPPEPEARIAHIPPDLIAAALAIYDAGGSRDEMAAALRGGQ